MEFANPQVQVPLTGARRLIQFPRPFGARGGAQRGPNVTVGPETYQHYHRWAILLQRCSIHPMRSHRLMNHKFMLSLMVPLV